MSLKGMMLSLLGMSLVFVASPVGAQNTSAPDRQTTTAAPVPPKWYPMPTYGKWHSSRIGGGGYVQNVVPSLTNAQRYYAYVDVGGVFRSDDGGNHWRMVFGTLPASAGNYMVRGLLVDPRDDNKLIIATGSEWDVTTGLFTSDDAGETWKAATSQKIFFDGNRPNHRENGTILARNPSQPDVILAASIDTGLWRSQDNGKSWEMIGMEHIQPEDLKYDWSNPDRLWMSARAKSITYGGKSHALETGFYRSLDGGKSWTRLADKGPRELAQDRKDPNRLYAISRDPMISVSNDAGESWQPLNDGLALSPGKENWTNGFDYFAMAAGPDFVLVGSSNGTIYRLDEGATAWKKVVRESIDDQGLPRGKQAWGWAMASITIDPHDANHWFITDFFGLSQTHDAGKNWKITVDGIEVTVVHAVVQDPTDPGIVHLGMADNSYFRSEDGGVEFWRHPFPQDAITCRDIALSPSQPARIYAVGPQLWDQHIRQVYVSVDRGNTWERSPMLGLPNLDKAMCNSIAVDPKDPMTVYLTVSGEVSMDKGGIYRSTDGGKSWSWFSQGLPEGKTFSWMIPWAQGSELAVGVDATVIAISRLGSSTGLWRFDTASGAWSRGKVDKLTGAPSDVTADILTPGRFFVAARDGGIYRSSDSGRSWQKIYDKGATHIATDGAVRGRVAASTADGVILSTDGGDTWITLDKSLPNRAYGNMPAFIGDRLVVGSNGNGAFWIALTPEGDKPVHSTDIPAATIKSTAETPRLRNLDFKASPTEPTGWSKWNGRGNLTMSIGHSDRLANMPIVCLTSTDATGHGAVSQDFAATKTPFEVRGWGRASGSDLKLSQIAIQAFDSAGKQVAWITVADLAHLGAGNWFEKEVTLPNKAVQCKLVLIIEGAGEVSMGALSIKAKPSRVFP